jgi:predicted ATPase/class 3 adenylate cyclase
MSGEEPSVDVESGLKNWLEEIGLGQYVSLFIRHRIDLDVVPDLTESDMEQLGLPLGDRRRLQRAISVLTDAGSGDTSIGRTQQSPSATVGAERRQLTVMFCDLVGSTSLSEKYDPEDVRDIIAAYRETCVAVVGRYDGFVARYIGDGILVYFGYPNAHEDDAERGVRAGLEIVRAISALSEEANRVFTGALAVRIGIATGPVVVGDLIGKGTQERDSAVGETPNLAARLQGLAPPNGVIIASSTKSLVNAKFHYESLGSHSLKGLSERIQVWKVVRPSRVESRFAAAVGAKLTPLVNREEEIALLLMRWQDARERDGQVVILSGEAGIGKSRIVQELRAQIAGEPHGQISFQCSPYYTSTALYPFAEHLKLAIGLDREDSSENSLARLEATIAASNTDTGRIVPLFAALLSINTQGRYPPLELSPQQQKDATVGALADYFVALGRGKPVLIAFEDAHWIDPTSREMLDLLADRVQNASVLVVMTCRPEFQPGWNARSHITTLTLNRLSLQLRTMLVENVAGAKKLPKELVEEITVKTDGVPLFVEELTKAVLESSLASENDGRHLASGALRQLAIPATLTDSLMARLDRMGPFKKIAQVGATIGREFSYSIIRAIADQPEDQLNAALIHLEDAGLIVRRGHAPESVYSFKHVMIQNAAHSSLLHSEKRKLHAKIAVLLAEMYPERSEREPELLAHHYTESGQSEAAVNFWLKAGKQAAKSGANLEAIGHLRRGLEVVRGNPQMRERDEVELALRIALGTALIAGKGYAVQEVEENYSRALALGQQVDHKPTIFAAMRGLWVYNFIRANLAKADDLSVNLLGFATRSHPNETAEGALQRTGYLIEAQRAIAQTRLYQGRFAEARDHLERGLGLYDANLHGHLTEIHAIDPGIVLLSYQGYVEWFLGRPDQARRSIEEAIRNAEKKRHPFSLAFAWEFGAYLCQHLRDVQGTMDYAKRALVVSSEHGFLHWRYQATILQGWALAELGHIDDGLNQIRAGLDAYKGTDSWLATSWFESLLASAYFGAGRPDAALRALDAALASARRTEENFFLAEVYRLHGEITLTLDSPTALQDAEDCYVRSLEIARNQNAISWELRTAVSLATLWRDVGKHELAVDLLSPIVNKFGEGFETVDVKKAVSLLAELRPASSGDEAQ